MGQFYWLFIIFILSFSITNAQDDVIEHSIQKGETVYRISKNYGVTVDAIFALNPGSREVIYAGNILQIPKVNKGSNATINTSGSSDSTKYVVSLGDTKTGLARKFGVSITSLEQQNPQIVPTLMAGQVLKIDKNYDDRPLAEHFVKKGETLWGIATANKICVDELITANIDRLSGVLKAGQTLVIPDNSIAFNTDGDYIVKPGDTKWRLSKRFHMSIAQLEAKNPQIVMMLMACQLINIDINAPAIEETEPQKNTVDEEESAPVDPTVQDRVAETKEEVLTDSLETSEETETPTEVVTEVVPEDVSEEKAPVANDSIPASEDDEIIAENTPEIDPQTTPETTTEVDENSEEENVEQNPVITPTQNTSEETAAYIDYVIQPNETLFGLSKKAGMSMAAFTDLNPELSQGVAAGAVIKMPRNSVSTSDNQNMESSTIATSEVITVNPNETLYKRLDKNKKTGLYFCLPFSLEDYQDGNTMEVEATEKNEDPKTYIDFYQGAEMAIDSARALGLNFDVTLIKNSDSGRFPRIKVENASEENAIIVPFLKPGERYPKIISKNPTAIIDVSHHPISSEDNTVYNALASDRELKSRTLKFITSNNAQIAVVSDLEEARNKKLILEYAPNAKFVKVDKTGFFEGEGLAPALDKNKLNYIILDTDRTVVFLNATTEFMGKLANYNIEMVLIESASLPKQGQVSDIRFRILKLIFPSLMPINKNEAVLKFEQAYKTRYQTEASEDAIIGFDTTLDVLLRLSQSTGFQNSVENVNSNQINLKFKYQKSEDDNFVNKGIYLLQFGEGNRVIEID